MRCHSELIVSGRWRLSTGNSALIETVKAQVGLTGPFGTRPANYTASQAWGRVQPRNCCKRTLSRGKQPVQGSGAFRYGVSTIKARIWALTSAKRRQRRQPRRVSMLRHGVGPRVFISGPALALASVSLIKRSAHCSSAQDPYQ